MQCPRDGAALVRETYEGDVVVDRCTTCAGMWLDTGELKDIQEPIENDYSHQLKQINVVASAYALARQKVLPNIDCPQCGSALYPREYAFCSQILIDRCAECRGVWLDAGELQALEKFFEVSLAEQATEQAIEETEVAAASVRRGFFASLWERLG